MKFIIILSMAIITIFSCTKGPGSLKQPALANDPIQPGDITITMTPANVVADGVAYGEVLVKVSDKILQKYREVNFDIAPIGKFNNNATTIKVPLDVAGEAKAFVRSDVEGLSYINANIAGAYRTTTVQFYKNAVDSLILYMSRNNVTADNYTYAEITAVTKKRPFVNNQIVFVADRGTFTNNSNTYTVQPSLNDTTKAYLKYNRAEPVRITATIYNTYSKEVYSNFIPAYPGQIFINTAASTLPPLLTSKTNITAKLVRPAGSVSEGHIVHFYDSASTGGSKGTFLNTTVSNAIGEATTEYWLQDTSFHGFIYIKGYVISDTGKVAGTNRILIQ